MKKEINTALNKPVFTINLHNEWNDKPQIIQGVELLTTGQFNSFGIYYGTRTWDLEQTEYTLNRKQYRDTRIKRWMRNPKRFKRIEERWGEGKLLEIYTFLSYDLLENGPLYFIKRWGNRIINKIREF